MYYLDKIGKKVTMSFTIVNLTWALLNPNLRLYCSNWLFNTYSLIDIVLVVVFICLKRQVIDFDASTILHTQE